MYAIRSYYGLFFSKILPDFGGKDVPAHNGQVGRGLFGFGLFHHVIDFYHILFQRGCIQNAVFIGLIRFHFHDSGNGGAEPFKFFHHFREHGLVRGQDHIVGQKHGKGFVPHNVPGAPDGVTKP